MITTKTVLVLGAGASAPYSFPTGQGLKDLVCDVTLTRAEDVNILKQLGHDTTVIEQFREALIHSGRPSVDAFVEYRQEFLCIGKAAIALTLLPREETPKLFRDWMHKRLSPDKKTNGDEGNWYEYLFEVLADGVSFDNFSNNKLSIVTFNYDRSIEQYLLTALKKSYNKSDKECGKKLQDIPIVHVYGSLGPLEQQLRPQGLPSVTYDSGRKPDIIKLAADNIKIIRESDVITPEFTEAQKLIKEAQLLVFLGFGFHPANLKRLGIESMKKKLRVIGTTLGLSLERGIAADKLIMPINLEKRAWVQESVYKFLHDFVGFN